MRSLFAMLASLLLALMPYFTMSGPGVHSPSQVGVAAATYASSTRAAAPIIANRDYMSVVYENMYDGCCSRLLFYYERSIATDAAEG